ncbi:ATP-binding cassette domain-containing protein [Wandonia haliotis]|uniref:ATP-binding cassette domain-containing protein n=1 Tax=Wandonia haliotis TaxID=574963 RepID=A0ABP3Y5Z4_9FLAO
MPEFKESKLRPGQRFWRLLKPDAPEIRNVYIYSVFNGLVNLSLPLGIQAIINLIQGGRVSTAWIVLVAFVTVGIAVSGLITIFQLRITENLQQKIFARAAFEFVFRVPRIKLEELYRFHAPELMNRFFDVVTVQKGLPKILIDFSSAGLYVIFGLILLSFYHPFFILFSLLLIALVYIIFRITVKKGLRTSLEESKHKYLLAHWLEEAARTNMTFKMAGNTDFPIQNSDRHVMSYLQARESHFKVLVQQYSLMIFFKVIVALGLLAIGGVLVMEQLMNIGQFVAAEIIIITVINSVEKLILSLETIYDVLTSLEKIGQVTDLELEAIEGINLEEECKNKGLEVEVNQVTFSYPDSMVPVLKNINFKADSGQHIVITGKNGSGKSTFMHLLAGLYRVNQGTISYNGIPRDNFNLDSLRSEIGGCLIDEDLFEGTLLENITIGRERATFENVKWAMQGVGLGEFVKTLPQGYDTILEPLGKKLPRSIVQRLLIARSIADKPRLLLLEYAFEHLDIAERKKIIDFLLDQKNGWTVIAVSNDEYLAKKSDNIGIMQGGELTHFGPYEKLKQIANLKMYKDA